MAPQQLLSSTVPCPCCGGCLIEIPLSPLRAAVCHFCETPRAVSWQQRAVSAGNRLRGISWRQEATRFTRVLGGTEPQPSSLDQLRSALVDTAALYHEGLAALVPRLPPALAGDPTQWAVPVAHLGRGLLIKAFVAAVGDDPLPPAERQRLLPVILEQLGVQPWEMSEDGLELGQLRAIAPDLDWRPILSPFERLPSFRQRTQELVTHASRIVNLVTKFDGQVTPAELARATGFRAELNRRIGQFTALPSPLPASDLEAALEQLRSDGQYLRDQLAVVGGARSLAPRPAGAPPERLEAALHQLDALVGVPSAKEDLRGLVPVLRVQAERRRQGLAAADLRLHLAFLGNRGTGQGAVAEILGQICAALGALERGHVVEIDAEELVVDPARLATRLNAAAEGVLLVRDAGRLFAPFEPHGGQLGAELLAGADAGRALIVIADASEVLEQVLDHNPALARQLRSVEFADYTPTELGRVLDALVKSARYRLSPQARLELVNCFAEVVRREGWWPGNASTLRELLRTAIERQARRVEGGADLSAASLTTLDAEDFVIDTVPAAVRQRPVRAIRTDCPRCGRQGRFDAQLLGARIQCRACQHEMVADWGVPADG